MASHVAGGRRERRKADEVQSCPGGKTGMGEPNLGGMELRSNLSRTDSSRLARRGTRNIDHGAKQGGDNAQARKRGRQKKKTENRGGAKVKYTHGRLLRLKSRETKRA